MTADHGYGIEVQETGVATPGGRGRQEERRKGKERERRERENVKKVNGAAVRTVSNGTSVERDFR